MPQNSITPDQEAKAVRLGGMMSHVEAVMQRYTSEMVGIPNQSEAVHYTQAEADEHNALLTGALNSTDPLTAEEAAAYNEAFPAKEEGDTLSAAEAAAYNAGLTGALNSTDPLTAAQAAAYNAAFPEDTVQEGDTLDEEQAEAYNAQLEGALNSTDPLTAEEAAAYNAAFPQKETGDTLTAEEASAYNATLEGAVTTDDIKTPAVPKKVKDYVDEQIQAHLINPLSDSSIVLATEFSPRDVVSVDGTMYMCDETTEELPKNTVIVHDGKVLTQGGKVLLTNQTASQKWHSI